MAPLKTFLPLWKGKGCHRKNEKRLHQITHNIAEAHPHSKVWVCHCRPYPSICKNRASTKIPPEKVLPNSAATCQLCLDWPLSEAPNALLDIFQPNFSVTPFYCFGLIFIDVLHSLKSGPLYSIFFYVIISFVFCRSCCSY
jgi:hypothetical protein